MRIDRLIRLVVCAVFGWIAFGLLVGAGQLEAQEEIGVRRGEPPRVSDEFVPGELIVKFKPGVSETHRTLAAATEGAVLERHLLVPGYALVRVPPGQEEELLGRLEANPEIELAERNGTGRGAMVPNDTHYPLQWHMPQIQMEWAWDVADGSGVVVAVIDTGVAFGAPDLAGTAFAAGWDFVNNDADPSDDHGHGTHVTGTIAQTTNNSLGVAGVAHAATIMPIKVLDNVNWGTDANLAQGIMWATNNGADVINLSVLFSQSSVLQHAVNHALRSGVVMVAAAGNDNASNLYCPACYPGVIAVGATDFNGNRAPYSNYGCGRGGHCLDVVAPGGDVDADANSDGQPDGVLQQTLASVPCLCIDPDPTGFAYCFCQGTSMASPHVAGAAALLLDANPGLSRDQVGYCLRNTALDLGDPGYDTEYGHGLIQVRAALNCAPPVVLALDMNPTGNSCPADGVSDCVIGPITDWIWKPATAGTTFEVDALVTGPWKGHGGWTWDLAFPDTTTPANLTMTAQVETAPLVNLIAQSAGSAPLSMSEPIPDGISPHSAAAADFGTNEPAPPFTQGVLSRMTFQVGAGATPGLYGFSFVPDTYEVNDEFGVGYKGQVGITVLDSNSTPQHGLLFLGILAPDNVTHEADEDDTVTTDAEGDGTTASDPVETFVTTPNAGTISIEETAITETPPAGFQFLAQQVNITAPPATAADPLDIVFSIDSSQVPVGEDQNTIQMFQDGVQVPACTGPPGTASPDPCVSNRAPLPDSDVEITVLTSTASAWNFGVAAAPSAVGGIVELRVSRTDSPASAAEGSTSSAAPYAALAGSIVGAALALTAGGWYARRRLS